MSYLFVQKLEFSFDLDCEVCADRRNTEVWGDVHLRIEEAMATGRDCDTEAKGGQGRRNALNREFGSLLSSRKVKKL